MEWNRYKGGRGWRMEHGFIIAENPSLENFESIPVDGERGFLYRTRGEPSTAWNAILDYGAAIRQAVAMFPGVTVELLVGMMAIEAYRRKRDQTHFYAESVREEPGYQSDAKTPHRVSPGLMQTLISTAQSMNDRYEIYKTLDGEVEQLTREDLFIAERSIMLGAAYMHYQIQRKEDDEVGFADADPVLLCSAYNAGSVRGTQDNDWHLLTYGKSRMDKFIAFYNDTVHILAELGK